MLSYPSDKRQTMECQADFALGKHKAKGYYSPMDVFLVEFEADDRDRDPKH